MKNKRKAAAAARAHQAEQRHLRRVGGVLFLLALALRLFFWQATADSSWPYSAYYKGDAAIWLGYAEALIEDRPFELGLPLRPPGAAYLMAFFWDGEKGGVAALRFLWCLLGALTVPLLYGAALRAFGFAAALLTGLLTAASSGLMILSTSLNNETPYLLLVAATLYLGVPLRREPRGRALALWGALHGLACLVRVEHALFFALVMVDLSWSWWRRDESRRQLPRRLASVALPLLVMILPWHLHAWRELRRFNAEPPPSNPATEATMQQLEQALSGLDWDFDAVAERERIPAFTRRTAANFVAATVLIRGGQRVAGEDFEILEEAFGSRPEAVAESPFVALYGGLNFALANNPRADAGFDRLLLEEPPPLTGGPERYPTFLIQGLPPPDLALTYPPHLEIVNHGYSMGLRWIRQHPGDFFQLAAGKLANFWDGAALGFTGFNLPLGLSGVRRRVDIVVPEGGLVPAIWRLGVLAIAVAGLWIGWRSEDSKRRELMPWLLFLASKLVVTVAFFGYARQGATVLPVIALLAALALEQVLFRRRGVSTTPDRRWTKSCLIAAALLVTIEGVRWLSGPAVALDGRTTGATDPWPVDRHEIRRLELP